MPQTAKPFEPEVLPPEAPAERALVVAPRVVELDINQIIGIGLGLLLKSLVGTASQKTSDPPKPSERRKLTKPKKRRIRKNPRLAKRRRIRLK